MSNHWTEQVIARVNARLTAFFADKRAQAADLSPCATELVDAVSDLTMRGGKRLRAAAIYAGFRAVGGAGPRGDVDVALPTDDVAAAIELLQSYFLIQDDWMDDDEERRGGPSVHSALSRAHGDEKLGASLAMLAADLAVAFAFELLNCAPFASARTAEARTAFSAMHFEVVCGQQLDLLKHTDVTLVHHLKTGSYTVRGPLKLGALLADANAAQLQALDAFGRPVGIAFQLRDDLLGAFGDSTRTGKPAGHDLREGKNTALVAAARELLAGDELARLTGVLGNRDATDAELLEVTQLIERCGARGRVEAQLAAQIDAAERALQAAQLTAEGVSMLQDLLARITRRDR